MATVPGTLTDEVWMIVKRTINGQTKKYIEVLTPGLLDETDPEDAIYLDSALTYDSTETSTITGLWHLEGETVYALADGAKQDLYGLGRHDHADDRSEQGACGLAVSDHD